MANTIPIPEPPGWPILGNILDLDFDLPLRSLCRLSEKYGGLYRMRLPGTTIVIASSHDLVNELCDEKRFPKTIQGLKEMRNGIHDGLLTAETEEPNWGIAHRVLMPAFGPSSLPVWFDGMADIAGQLALKWARHGKDTPITITEDFTRLTLDTIALCSMDFRFNSFYKDELHPFVQAMCDFLLESGNRGSRLPIPSIFYRGKDRKFVQDIEVLRKTANEVLQSRRTEGGLDTRKDLLSAMLDGVDPKTGQKLSDESITDNLITFLIAGHETTSGLLSFTLYHLITNPEAYKKAQAEVDNVCGKGPIKFEHLSKLSYISAALRESLRLNPTIPVFNVAPKKDEIIGGRYHLPANQLTLLLLSQSHLDPKVFGEDADEYIPERMLDDNFDRLNKDFPNCWKPFGNGARACIGRPFAWQEATLMAAILLQNFDLTLDNPDYCLSLKQTLTVKPDGLQIRAALRDGLTPTQLERRLAGTVEPPGSKPGVVTSSEYGGASVGNDEKRIPMRIYYGSNSGTCQSMAETLAANAFSRGFSARILDIADNAVGKLSPDEPVIVITASYEGEAPDNAARFVEWLESKDTTGFLKDVPFAIFGFGNHDWASTFHRIPKLVNQAMEHHGGSRIAPMGLSDVALGTILSDFETWEDDVFWPAMASRYGAPAAAAAASSSSSSAAATVPREEPMTIQVSNPRKSILHYHDMQEARVVATKTLTSKDATTTKKSIHLQLPSSLSSYRPGDYLSVLPLNPRETVDRALRHFGLAPDSHLTISTPNPSTPLPTTTTTTTTNNKNDTSSSVSALEVFSSYVELSQPATKRNISTLADLCPASSSSSSSSSSAAAAATTKSRLQSLLSENNYQSQADDLQPPHRRRLPSVLTLLESFPDIPLPLATFLRMLPPMRVRQYSISSSSSFASSSSSSSSSSPSLIASLTYSVFSSSSSSSPTKNNNNNNNNDSAPPPPESGGGVASTFLSRLLPGDMIQVSLRPCHPGFHLPLDQAKTPIIMVAAGTGIAPFRGFLEERSALVRRSGNGNNNNKKKKLLLAPAVLFFGCREKGKDDLYRDELDAWEKGGGGHGVVEGVYRAFSREVEEEEGEGKGCKYVQDRLWMERERVLELWEEGGAKLYVCGGRAVGEGVKARFVDILAEGGERRGKGREEVREEFERVKGERWALDVFD